MKTFRMTCDRFHLLTPIILTPLLLVQMFVMRAIGAPLTLVWLVPAVGGGLFITALMTPRAVTLTPLELVIERFGWPDVRIARSTITQVEHGPVTGILRGTTRRVAGVGGWFWSGGLFKVEGVGNVRAWMTRLGPTVLIRRADALPILLGVDDVSGLFQALNRHGT